MTKQMKRTSGHKPAGGPAGKNVKQVPVRTGTPNRAMNPAGVAQFGIHPAKNPAKLDGGKALQSELGNSCALHASGSKAGPGADRKVYNTGAQAQHGPANPGISRPIKGPIFEGF